MSKLLKDAKVIDDACIFRNNLLNIRTTTYDFLYLCAYSYDLKHLAADMMLGFGINAVTER